MIQSLCVPTRKFRVTYVTWLYFWQLQTIVTPDSWSQKNISGSKGHSKWRGMVSNLGEVGEVRKPGVLLDLWGVLCSWDSGWGCEERWEKNPERRCVYSITSALSSPSEPCLAGEAGHWPLCSSDSVAARVLVRKQACQSNGLGNMTRRSAWLWRRWFREQLPSSIQCPALWVQRSCCSNGLLTPESVRWWFLKPTDLLGWLRIPYLFDGVRGGACFLGWVPSLSLESFLQVQPVPLALLMSLSAWHYLHDIPFCLIELVWFLFLAAEWCRWVGPGGQGHGSRPKQSDFSVADSGDTGNALKQNRSREGKPWTSLCPRKISLLQGGAEPLERVAEEQALLFSGTVSSLGSRQVPKI